MKPLISAHLVIPVTSIHRCSLSHYLSYSLASFKCTSTLSSTFIWQTGLLIFIEDVIINAAGVGVMETTTAVRAEGKIRVAVSAIQENHHGAVLPRRIRHRPLLTTAVHLGAATRRHQLFRALLPFPNTWGLFGGEKRRPGRSAQTLNPTKCEGSLPRAQQVIIF